jgi:hypothetical protein
VGDQRGRSDGRERQNGDENRFRSRGCLVERGRIARFSFNSLSS